MDWEAIGAIGEIIGATAVVATLAYLALQIRHARQAAADVSRLNRGVGVRELLANMISDDDLRNAWIKTEGEEDAYQRIADALGVTLQKTVKIEHQAQSWFWLHWAHWASTKTDRDVEGLRHVVAAFYAAPPMSTVWDLSPNVRLLEPRFAEFVNSALAPSAPDRGADPPRAR